MLRPMACFFIHVAADGKKLSPNGYRFLVVVVVVVVVVSYSLLLLFSLLVVVTVIAAVATIDCYYYYSYKDGSADDRYDGDHSISSDERMCSAIVYYSADPE